VGCRDRSRQDEEKGETGRLPGRRIDPAWIHLTPRTNKESKRPGEKGGEKGRREGKENLWDAMLEGIQTITYNTKNEDDNN